MDKAAKEPEPAEYPAGPDYQMDEFDSLNPFDDEFRPDAETPPPSPSPSPPTPLLAEESDGDGEGGEEGEETTTRKKWGRRPPPQPKMGEWGS